MDRGLDLTFACVEELYLELVEGRLEDHLAAGGQTTTTNKRDVLGYRVYGIGYRV